MTLGEKIQSCRKSKGVSQEEMALSLGVTRQALSKWECNTSVPDIDKVVAISDYFNVTTDYLIKDEYSNGSVTPSSEKNKQSGNIPIAVSTAVVAIGLILSLAMANDGSHFFYWRFSSAALGLGIQILGICLFQVLYFKRHFDIKNQYLFWGINTWLLSVMPIILALGVLVKFLNGFEILHFAISIIIGYLVFNGVLSLLFVLLSRRRHKARKSSKV